MPDTTLECPHCKTSLNVPADYGERNIDCPSCGKLVFSGAAPPLLGAVGISPGSGQIRDLRPVIERNETNGLSQAEEVRDRIYDLFNQAARARGVNVLILKSPPFTSPPWVRVECWVHHATDSALTLRSSAQFSVRPREFYRYPLEIDLVLSDDKRARNYRSLIEFGAEDAQQVMAYLLFERRSHKFNFRRCRVWPLQLWLPGNKPERLKRDPMGIVVQVLFVLGIVTIGFGVGVLFLLLAGILTYTNGKRRRHVLSAGKPSQEPRQLIRLDSWQALVRDIGLDRDAVVAGFREELARDNGESLLLANEKIWYWGVDGKEEREQLVARFRRGIAFVHIYQYANDLFVGWDAHVNCGTWVEKVSGHGHDKATQELCAVHTITAGWHVPNEYDISDTNCLLERVHAALTKILKLKMAERSIDQEIDFKILREPRQSIAGRSGQGGERAHGGGIPEVISRFRRIG